MNFVLGAIRVVVIPPIPDELILNQDLDSMDWELGARFDRGEFEETEVDLSVLDLEAALAVAVQG